MPFSKIDWNRSGFLELPAADVNADHQFMRQGEYSINILRRPDLEAGMAFLINALLPTD